MRNMKTLVATAEKKHNQSPQLVPADTVVPMIFMLLLSVVATGRKAPSAATPMEIPENFFVSMKNVITTAVIVATKVRMPQLSTPSWNPFTHSDLLIP